MFTLELKSKVIREMATFMITAQEPERIWVPKFEGPKIEDTLIELV